MLKKIFSQKFFGFCMLLALFGFSLHLASAALDASLSFNQSSVSTSVGQTFSITVVINPGSNQIESTELDIAFNPNVLRLDSITPSGVFSEVLSGPTINNVSGTGSVDLGAASPVGTTSNVATFSFTALATATNSPISILPTSNAVSSAQYVVNTRTGSSVTITASSGSDTLAPMGATGLTVQ